MYVILINDDNTMCTTQRERIMQRSKLFDTLWFLTPAAYREYDMSVCTVLLEYVLPVSKKYRTEILRLSDERYEGHLKYMLPFDTDITSEAGDIELQLSFILSDMDEHGNSIQRVRKVSPTMITIIPIAAWSDIVPDEALSALDQRIIKIDAQIKALNDVNEAMIAGKADNLQYDADSNELQLMANGVTIGDRITLLTSEFESDGLPVVDMGRNTAVVSI